MIGMEPEMEVAALRRRLAEIADPERGRSMAAYMRHQFLFLGITAKDRKVAALPTLAAAKEAAADELIGLAWACWEQPEREFAYVACDVLRRNAARLEPRHLDGVRSLIITDSWWDTVDPLATRTVATMVRTHPELAETMDRWVHSDDFWLARTAILHQLLYREATDSRRLFAYCQARAGDDEFFVRKAIGWALRQYARVDPAAVRTFVAAHGGELSSLTKREALKHLS